MLEIHFTIVGVFARGWVGVDEVLPLCFMMLVCDEKTWDSIGTSSTSCILVNNLEFFPSQGKKEPIKEPKTKDKHEVCHIAKHVFGQLHRYTLCETY